MLFFVPSGLRGLELFAFLLSGCLLWFRFNRFRLRLVCWFAHYNISKPSQPHHHDEKSSDLRSQKVPDPYQARILPCGKDEIQVMNALKQVIKRLPQRDE